MVVARGLGEGEAGEEFYGFRGSVEGDGEKFWRRWWCWPHEMRIYSMPLS